MMKNIFIRESMDRKSQAFTGLALIFAERLGGSCFFHSGAGAPCDHSENGIEVEEMGGTVSANDASGRLEIRIAFL